MLYDLVSWPHRVRMDVYGNPADRDPISHAAIVSPCVTRSDDMRQTAVDAQISDE